ncbi:MAG TPA: FliM/FliN family flagellar motor switch protein [Pirellulales bacterium]|nr:FliM/FliN family flagellar motor switch protein [Pirellulales bacterium]
MSKEVLSPADVERLLYPAEADGNADAKADITAAPAAIPFADGHPREAFAASHSKRPELFGPEQLRALQTLHEGFSHSYGAALSGLLRSTVDVKLARIDQLISSDFIHGLENPTCLNVLKAEPLDGHWMLDINHSILFPMIDRMLGGGREPTPLIRRPLTEIELRLAGRITGLFLDDFRRAWTSLIELRMAVERVESNPRLASMASPNEAVVRFGFEITLGDSRGMMSLCMPLSAIERIGQQLSSNPWMASNHGAVPDSIDYSNQGPRGELVQLVAQLADSKINAGDLIGLRVGDIITTEHSVNAPIVISVDGAPTYHARLGAFQGRKAIRIDEALTSDAPAAATAAVAASNQTTEPTAAPVKKK